VTRDIIVETLNKLLVIGLGGRFLSKELGAHVVIDTYDGKPLFVE